MQCVFRQLCGRWFAAVDGGALVTALGSAQDASRVAAYGAAWGAVCGAASGAACGAAWGATRADRRYPKLVPTLLAVSLLFFGCVTGCGDSSSNPANSPDATRPSSSPDSPSLTSSSPTAADSATAPTSSAGGPSRVGSSTGGSTTNGSSNGHATVIATGQPGPFAFLELEAAASGFQWTYRNGEEADHCAILESLGGGVGMIDYDGDHRLDLCLPGGGVIGPDVKPSPLPGSLFRNRDGQHFEPVAAFAGLAKATHYTHGIAAADFDHDGCIDILWTGFGGVQLWRNQGDGTFVDATAASGLAVDTLWSSSAAWGDFNGDGALDLYIAHYTDWSPANHPVCPGPRPGVREICGPREFHPLPDSLFLGNGDGTFRDASRNSGLRSDGKGLGVVTGDVDADGDLDIYVGNDTTENFLYINDGQGKFKEIGLLAGVATDDRGVPDGSMGVDIMDFNNDGRSDLWAANYEREAFALYRNEDHGQFLHVSQSTGITALGGLFVGFGTAFFDVDLDGDEDGLVANGHVIKYPRAAARRQPPLLLENRQGRFARVLFPSRHYFSSAWESRGLAAGDLDGDGRPDLAIAHVNEPSRILLNRTGDDASPPRWVAVRLVGNQSNRNGIGARLVLYTSAGQQTRLIKGGGSYLSQSDYRVVWGLPPDAKIDRLEILWPSGVRQTIAPKLQETLTIVESQ